jgi:hypothetical protein
LVTSYAYNKLKNNEYTVKTIVKYNRKIVEREEAKSILITDKYMTDHIPGLA